ncbi:MAG: DUF2848 domain-containing protein [Alphaproteobacteria bacterium]
MASEALTFACTFRDRVERRSCAIGTLVIAGWTGRDQAKVDEHIAELAALGVKPPATTPCFYRVSAANLTTADRIQVAGTDSTGEAEAVLVFMDDGIWVGVGSDHTDRVLEATGVTLSKQLCAKPVSQTLWRLDDVHDHWDRIALRAEATIDGAPRLYQDGTLAAMRPPADLMERYGKSGGTLGPGAAMYCGTLPVHGGIAFATAFEVSLEDPVLGRRIAHRYAIEPLPVIG